MAKTSQSQKILNMKLQRCNSIIIIGISFLFWSGIPSEDNLVPNPSFEEGKCPNGISQIYKVDGWYSANSGTPDYYSRCAANGSVSVPKNHGGEQEPYDSASYVGIGYFLPAPHREYIQCKLKEKLIKGGIYKISMLVNLADRSTHYFDSIEVAITPKPEHTLGRRRIRCRYNSIISLSSNSCLSDKERWILVSAVYAAQGDEQYLTIGWFKKVEIVKEIPGRNHNPSAATFAYYYIDNVQMTLVK